MKKNKRGLSILAFNEMGYWIIGLIILFIAITFIYFSWDKIMGYLGFIKGLGK